MQKWLTNKFSWGKGLSTNCTHSLPNIIANFKYNRKDTPKCNSNIILVSPHELYQLSFNLFNLLINYKITTKLTQIKNGQ